NTHGPGENFMSTGNALDVTSSPDGNLWLVSSSSGTLRGGDLLGRYVYNGEPMPSLNLTSVSARMLGGSMTASEAAELLISTVEPGLLARSAPNTPKAVTEGDPPA
ncbi:MAG TPA: hypothetical protein PLV77_07310, partial [Solirubrobacterales bacterium]|nr:hypothetical protein [Solirubrobacterales bacterium]